jgi:hypothetical protein
MAKRVTLQVVILVAVLAIVLPLVFLATPITVAKTNEQINANNGYRYLVFDLQRGQTVTGSCAVQDYNDTSCVIIDPNGNQMVSSPTDYEFDRNKTTFYFTADINGRYYLAITISDIWNHYINYEYSITAPPILGLDPLVLIGLVIAVGAILELAVFFRYRAKSWKT